MYRCIIRTTVNLDQDVYEAARKLSRTSGHPLGRVLSGLARRGLRAEAPAAPSRRGRRWDFPTVAVPPGTPIIPASRVVRCLDREGYI